MTRDAGRRRNVILVLITIKKTDLQTGIGERTVVAYLFTYAVVGIGLMENMIEANQVHYHVILFLGGILSDIDVYMPYF